MKKIAVLAVAAALAGCVSDTQTTQLLSSTSEVTYSDEQQAALVGSQGTEEIAQQNPPSTVIEDVVTEEVEILPPTETVSPPTDNSVALGYTIQVLALSHNNGFVSYMKNLPSGQPVWMNEKELKGAPWYTLLYGRFDTKEQARQVLAGLPKAVRESGPFIRSLEDIKSSNSPSLTRMN